MIPPSTYKAEYNFSARFLHAPDGTALPLESSTLWLPQLLYRQALTAIVQKWQERGDIPAHAKPLDVAKVMLSFFLGFIVQSAMIGGIDPDTAAKGIEGLISSELTSRR